MDKFSNLKPKSQFKEPKDKIIFDGGNYKIIEFEKWHLFKEKDLVVCIPYFIETNQFLIRHEYIPTFKYADGQENHITILSGGIEIGETPEKALVRELEEEAGIVLRDDYNFEEMKPLFMHKGQVNKFYPYILPLNERDYHEVVPRGDGSKAEKLSKSVKVDMKYISSLNASDLITDYMIMKLKEYVTT